MNQALDCSPNIELLSGFEKEKFFEVLFNDAPDALVYLATDFTIRMANRIFINQLGLAEDKIIGSSGKTVISGFHQLDYLFQKSRLTRQSSRSKFNFQMAGGPGRGVSYWKVTVNPLFNNEELTGWLLVFKETTKQVIEGVRRAEESKEQKQRLEQIRASEKILDAVNELIPFGFWECNLAGEVIEVSDAFLKTTGLTREECLDLGWTVVLPEANREALVIKWQECFKNETQWTEEFWMRCQNGEYRAVAVQGFPNCNSKGELQSWLVLNTDITAWRLECGQSAKEAGVWQQLFKSVVEHAPLGLAMYTGTDMSLRWTNQHFQTFLDLSDQARQKAGVILENHLPYTDNLQFDDVFYRVLTEGKASMDLAVHFSQVPDSFWSCSVVPLFQTEESNPDVLVIVVKFPAAAGAPVSAAVDPEPEPQLPVQLERPLLLEETKEPSRPESNQPNNRSAFLTELLEITSLGVAVIRGPEYRFEAVNAYLQTVGAYGEDLSSRRIVDLFSEETAESMIRILDEVARKRQPVRVSQFRTEKRSGLQSQYWDLEYLPFGEPDEETHTVIVIAANVTEQVSQRQRTEQLAAILADMNQATNMVDILGAAVRSTVQALQANDGGIYLFNEIEGNYQSIYELWMDKGAKRHISMAEMPNLRLAAQTRNPLYFTAVEAAEKETAWFKQTGMSGCLAVPLVLNESCIGLLVLFYIWQDLTLAEEDLEFAGLIAKECALVIERAHNLLEKSRMLISERRSRSRAERQAAEMSALLQSLKEGVLVLDSSGNIILRNRMERWLTRVEDDKALSVTDYGQFRLLTPDDQPVPQQQLPGNRLLRGETLDDTEYIIEHSDGHRLRVICNGSVVRGEDGQVVLGILVTRDVTRIRLMEEVREDFIRAVSHDLRNPLTVVSARSQLLQRRLIKHGLQNEAEEAEVIYVSARRMTQMIQEMYDSYRLESSNFKLNKRLIDLASVMEELVARLGTDEERKRIRLEIAPGNYRIFADQERLERAIVNLANNALKYSPVDRPVVIRMASQSDRISLAVTDQGIGIAPTDLPKIFDRYFRCATVKDSVGMGLGLYIVKLIVEAHSGRIDVMSEVNKGSTFQINLPIILGDPVDPK